MIADDLHNLFVNRSKQRANFKKMLDGKTSRRIMLITAPAVMGKSWLIHRLAYEARHRQLPFALIDFADRQGYDGLSLMRRIRDELGAEHFERLTMVTQEVTAPRIQLSDPAVIDASSGIDFASAQTGDISFRDVAGHNIFKNNLMYIHADNALARQVAEDRIYSTFFSCLRILSETQPVVLLFDTYERLSTSKITWEATSTDHWIRDELLRRILNGELTKVIVVIAGRLLPIFDHRWSTTIGEISTPAFTCEDVEEYLLLRLGLQDVTPKEAQRLCEAINGMPQLLGVIGDNLMLKLRPIPQDELW